MNNVYTYKYPHPAVTTDCVIFSFDGINLKVLLIQRGCEPYKGYWAFPGGFLRMDETAEEGALRELREETGLTPNHIEQFYTFSQIDRDPRERVVSIAFFALIQPADVKGDDDASDARWFPLNEMPPLAFDHENVFKTAQKKLKEKIYFESIGFDLLGDEFTIPEIQHLYESILEVKFDRRNFQKKLLQVGILKEVTNAPETDSTETTSTKTQNSSRGRKAKKYKFNKLKYEDMKEHGGFKLEF
ncbi:MAG: NUDIX domain-containing protein [Bacteroidales bacterium]|nr:NUDIX domain-containing protein [Bacteroidales bacterium]